MKKLFTMCMFGFLFFGLHSLATSAQEPSKDAKPAADAKAGDAKITPDAAPKEETWVTDHTTRIGGQPVAYKATASLILLKDDKAEPTALMFSTAYTRTDLNNAAARPIAFVYNGGPGS